MSIQILNAEQQPPVLTCEILANDCQAKGIEFTTAPFVKLQTDFDAILATPQHTNTRELIANTRAENDFKERYCEAIENATLLFDFAPLIPISLRQKLLDLSQSVVSCETFTVKSDIEVIIDATLKKVPFESYDGYWSRNKGGFTVDCYLSSGFGSGKHITKKQAAFYDRMQKNCYDEYIACQGITTTEFYDDDNYENGYQSEDFVEWEYEYLDEEVFCQFRCYVDRHNDVQIDLAISYAGIDKYETIADITLSEDEFMTTDNAEIMGLFQLKFDRA